MLRYGLSVLLVVTLGTCGDRGMGPSEEGQIVLSVRYADAGSGKVVGVQRVDRMVVSLTRNGRQVQERELVYSSGAWEGVLKVGAGRYGVVVVAYKGDKVKWRGSTSVRVQAGKSSAAEVVMESTNQVPVLASIGSQSVAEGASLRLELRGSDADGDGLTYAVEGEPSGATLSDGVFSWTPTYQQGGTYRVTFSVADQYGGRAEETVTITVGETNREPVLASIGSQSVAEGASLRLELRGSDADGDGLTYAVEGEPSGATLSDGVFSWTPTYQQGGTYRVTFSVADQYGGRAEETVTITVGETNREPVLASIGSQSVAEGEGLRVALSATDADGDRLTYSASGEPSGATLSGRGVFTWTPTYQQSGTYRVTFTVSDGRGGTAEETVTITVGEINRVPVLALIGTQRVAEGASLRVALSATDADGDRLSYSASGRPAGSSFSGGVFSWTPTYEQSGTYRVTFTVSDGQGGTDEETVTIAVGETNREPVLASIGWQRVAEGERLQLVVSATDADGDGLTYSASGRPTGATLSDSTFSWTPSYQQSGTYQVTFTVSDGRGGMDRKTVMITVGETNRVPVLASIGAQQVAEGEGLRVTLSATDADGDRLSYSASGRPTGATLSGGVFSWTPTYEQSGTYRVTFTVSDGRGGTDRETVTITVGEINRVPVLASIGAQRVAEGERLQLELSVTDADGDRLTYSASDRPVGSSFSGGVFSWTPTYEQSGTYQVTFTVSDGRGGTAEETIAITVGETNREPVLASIGSQQVAEGERLQLVVSASDADGDGLTYSATGRPTGATLSDSMFSWTPSYTQAGMYRVAFSVSDGRGGTDQEAVTIIVSESKPDLVVEGAVNQSRLQVGASFTFSATVKNVGTRVAEATTVRYYRSADAVIGSNDEEVGTDAMGDLAAAGEREASISLTVP